MTTSVHLNESELAALRLLVPEYVTLERLEDALSFTLRSPRTGTPLVTYRIRPGGPNGFAGERLASMLEDMHSTLVTALRGLPETPDMADIVRLVGGVSVSVTKRLLSDGALQLETGDIHTLEARDWRN